jgi:glyoxylase-like metal-dependent hydrolase (beta-lactamase superfamily II)
VSATTIAVGAARCTRVAYAEVDVAPEVVGLSAESIAPVPWAEPAWARSGQVRVAAAAWIIESDGARIVVDPAQAADALLRSGDAASAHQEAFAALLDASGFARETITHAVATHLDGVGMLAWRHDDGTWAPFFPNAPIWMSRRELDALDRGFDIAGEPVSGIEVLGQLRAAGAVTASDDVEQITGEVTLVLTGAHNPGHQIVRIESAGERAVMIGHLALSPLHLATGECPLHMDPPAAFAALEAIRDEGTLLIGPLWPEPGAGRWHDGAFRPAAREPL